MVAKPVSSLVLLLLAGLLAALPARAAEKVALVIGNGAYANVGALENPRNDAADIAATLRRLGFEVNLRLDLDYAGTRRALADFQGRALGAGQAVIYYAGHGIEVDKRNYLIPVDAALKSDRDVNFEAIPLDLAVLATEGASSLSLVIVDACRNNPFLRSMTRTTRAIGRGLAAYEPEGNTVVAYSAKEGTVALDGEGARNSPYARALIETLDQPGVEIGKLFRRVRDRVLELTHGEQEPFFYASLSGEDYFLNSAPAGPSSGPATGLPAGVPTAPGEAAEVAFWHTIEDSDDPRDFADYLEQFPQGLFAGLARRRLQALGTAPPAPIPPTGAAAAEALARRAAESPVQIQLGAFSGGAAAEAEWQRLREAHRDLLGDRALAIQTTVAGGRQLYRLRVGPFGDRAEAQAVCAALSARGQPCLVALNR